MDKDVPTIKLCTHKSNKYSQIKLEYIVIYKQVLSAVQ